MKEANRTIDEARKKMDSISKGIKEFLEDEDNTFNELLGESFFIPLSDFGEIIEAIELAKSLGATGFLGQGVIGNSLRVQPYRSTPKKSVNSEIAAILENLAKELRCEK